jgi:hypothetical protein
MERQQHQTKADKDAADVLDAGAGTTAERHQSDHEEDRRGGGNIERQHLNDQRGSNVCAKHDRERRNKADETFRRERAGYQAGGGAALEQGGETEAGAERGKTIAKRFTQKPAEVRTEGAQDSAPDHMKAPEQKRDTTHQIEKNEASHEFPVNELESTGQAIGKRRRINLFISFVSPLAERTSGRKASARAG